VLRSDHSAEVPSDGIADQLASGFVEPPDAAFTVQDVDRDGDPLEGGAKISCRKIELGLDVFALSLFAVRCDPLPDYPSPRQARRERFPGRKRSLVVQGRLMKCPRNPRAAGVSIR
jgi:hypothetical protein